MRIIKALYGSGPHTLDVTQTIDDLVRGSSRLFFNVSNDLFKVDPCPGKIKELTLTLQESFGEEEHTLKTMEGEMCVYPAPPKENVPQELGKVTCMCPTRGRYELLRKSISYFLLQDYENKELLILNNHSVPLSLSNDLKSLGTIKVVNLGEVNDMAKLHNDALRDIDSEFICIWEDDDIYLPWHLSNIEKYPMGEKWEAIKPSISPAINVVGGELSVLPTDNNFEASYILKTSVLKKHGFGPSKNATPQNNEFWHWRWLEKLEDVRRPSFLDCGYVYAWDRRFIDNLHCIHSSGNGPKRLQEESQDTGNGVPLTPVDVTHVFDVLEEVREGFEGYVVEEVNAYLEKLYSYQRKGLYRKEPGISVVVEDVVWKPLSAFGRSGSLSLKLRINDEIGTIIEHD